MIPEYQEKFKTDVKLEIFNNLQKELARAQFEHVMGLLVAAAIVKQEVPRGGRPLGVVQLVN